MTTDPGALEKGYEDLDLSKMSPVMISTVFAVKDELRKASNEIPTEEEPEVKVDIEELRKNTEESKNSWF